MPLACAGTFWSRQGIGAECDFFNGGKPVREVTGLRAVHCVKPS